MNTLPGDLTPETLTIDRVATAARQTFGTDDKARRWLLRPTTVFSGESPMTVASSGAGGIRMVLDVLKRIDHGLAV